MPVKLTINSKDIEAEPGPSLFDYAEQLDIQVPTSCMKQGKCRECLVEVAEGMDCLSKPSEEEEINDRIALRMTRVKHSI